MDHQFYPTGALTAAFLWNQFQRPITHVCDPSAGRGHLIQHALDHFSGLPEGQKVPWFDANLEQRFSAFRSNFPQTYKQESKFDKLGQISFVEINPAFHCSLRELTTRGNQVSIVGYDFLQVQSLASVTQVIMNPPFSTGAEHVLHAWHTVYDAEISAIINAESIRNPHTTARKQLVGLIEKFGSVAFMQEQFTDPTQVERTTSVEVALIYLDKARFTKDGFMNFYEGLKRDVNSEVNQIDPEISTALALPENFIENTVHRFQHAVKAARVFSEAEAISEKAASQLGVTLEQMQAKGVGSDFRESTADLQAKARKSFLARYAELQRTAWAQIIRSSLLTNKLSNHARRKVEADAATIYELEFSASNVHGFLAGVCQSMGGIWEEMMTGMFDTIIERSSDNAQFYKSWKSNQKHRVGMKLRPRRFILPQIRLSYGNELSYESAAFISDIDKIFGYLDGVKADYYGIQTAFKKCYVGESERIVSTYFEFRFYAGSSTLHVYPKSEEVVDRLNKFVGRVRQWLPEDMAQANKDFEKQYNKAEKFSAEYIAAYQKSPTPKNYWSKDPVKVLMKGDRSSLPTEALLQDLDTAINQVHAKHGLNCQASISSSMPKAILQLVNECESERNAPANSQMCLLNT